jgi:hypothetical protein
MAGIAGGTPLAAALGTQSFLTKYGDPNDSFAFKF